MKRTIKKRLLYPRSYRGHNIERLFPSGYYEFYCDKQQRFLKFDNVKMCEAAIRESIKSLK